MRERPKKFYFLIRVIHDIFKSLHLGANTLQLMETEYCPGCPSKQPSLRLLEITE